VGVFARAEKLQPPCIVHFADLHYIHGKWHAASQPFQTQPLCPLIGHNKQYNFTTYNDFEKTVLQILCTAKKKARVYSSLKFAQLVNNEWSAIFFDANNFALR
jgi:hypothetical protein